MSTQTAKTVVVCLGERLQEDDTMHPEHLVRVEAAFLEWQKQVASGHSGEHTVLVLTGGKTRALFLSEASAAKLYLEKLAAQAEVVFRAGQVIVEDISLTTAQNFFCAKKLCVDRSMYPNEVIIITRNSQAYKARVFALWTWPFLKVTIVKTLDTKKLWYRMLDYTVLLLLAFIDPRERVRSFVTRLMRKH